MQTIEAGDTWGISVSDELRKVEVIGEGSIPGWWECIDLETGLRFMASEYWFVAPAKAGAR